MDIQQIRNATNKIVYGGKTFLVDPWLVGKGALGSFNDIHGKPFQTADDVKMVLNMPFFDLPLPVEEILSNVDYYILTHLHPDHIDIASDGTVGGALVKETPIFVQSENDATVLRQSGFVDVRVLSAEGTVLGDIKLTKVSARHGTIIPCGDVMGVVFQHASEKTLYISADTVWYPEIQKTLVDYKPEVVTVNACAAELIDFGRLTMNDEDVECVARTVPEAQIFITHMDNVPHASITRRDMRGRMAFRGVTNYVMPEDGESIEF